MYCGTPRGELDAPRLQETAWVQSLRSVSGNVFGNVTAVSLTDDQVTRDGLHAAFTQAAAAIRSQDVFVLYVAGHGITFDGRYHFVPVDFRYRNEASVAEQGVTQDHLRDWLAQILRTFVFHHE